MNTVLNKKYLNSEGSFLEEHFVYHIDENILFKEGLKILLSDTPFQIRGHALTVSDACWDDLSDQSVSKQEIIILDPARCAGFSQCVEDLMGMVQSLNSQPPKVVILTDEVELSTLAAALSLGISGYLLKDISSGALKKSLDLITSGEKVFPSRLAELLINPLVGNAPAISTSIFKDTMGGKKLSPREKEILTHLIEGQSNKEIAIFLDIAEGTVKVHLKAILKKIGVRNRTQAAIWAYQSGIASSHQSLSHS